MYSLHVVGTRSEVAAQVEVHVHVCIVVGLRQLQIVGSKSVVLSMHSIHVVGTKSKVAAQVEVHVHVCIVVGLRQLQIEGSKSAVLSQVEVHVHVGIVVGGWATDSGLEKRIGSAGRGASACGHSFRCIRYM